MPRDAVHDHRVHALKHVPNLITALRVALLPFAAMALLRGDRTTTLVLVGAIAFSDALDGYLARRFDLVTPLGSVLDPLADKLTQFTLLVLLAWGGRQEFATIPRWFVGLIFAREIFLLYGAVRVRLHVGNVKIVPRWEGKLSTVLVFALLLLALLNAPQWTIDVLVWITAPLAVAGAVRYYRDGRAQASSGSASRRPSS